MNKYLTRRSFFLPASVDMICKTSSNRDTLTNQYDQWIVKRRIIYLNIIHDGLKIAIDVKIQVVQENDSLNQMRDCAIMTIIRFLCLSLSRSKN